MQTNDNTVTEINYFNMEVLEFISTLFVVTSFVLSIVFNNEILIKLFLICLLLNVLFYVYNSAKQTIINLIKRIK